MTGREELKEWVCDALKAHGGVASVIEVARHIWAHHEGDLRASGDLFFKWQYDMRWAATALRKSKKVKTVGKKWALTT